MAPEADFLGTGWAFPPSFGPGGGQVATVAGAEDVHESVQILLTTEAGERVMVSDFGASLGSLQFEEIDFGFVNRVRTLVTNAIVRYEPRIDLHGVDVVASRTGTGQVKISIDYTIRGSNSRFNLVFPYFVDEANEPLL